MDTRTDSFAPVSEFASSGTRQWCRLHLSTALVLMLLLAVLIGANLNGNIVAMGTVTSTQLINGTTVDRSKSGTTTSYGWPMRAADLSQGVADKQPFTTAQYNVNGIALNAVFALLLLVAAAYVLEHASRQRRVLLAGLLIGLLCGAVVLLP